MVNYIVGKGNPDGNNQKDVVDGGNTDVEAYAFDDPTDQVIDDEGEVKVTPFWLLIRSAPLPR